jgi:hypothetical protein
MKLPRRKFLHLAAGAAAIPAVTRVARAESYPTKPVRMIVGFTAGGRTTSSRARSVKGCLSVSANNSSSRPSRSTGEGFREAASVRRAGIPVPIQAVPASFRPQHVLSHECVSRSDLAKDLREIARLGLFGHFAVPVCRPSITLRLA